MNRRLWVGLILLPVLSCSLRDEKAGTDSPKDALAVTIAAAKEYQTMEAFGGTEHWLFPQANEYPAFFDDLGVSMVRVRMIQHVESVPDQPGNESRDNDNDDPFMINWSNVKTEWIMGTVGQYIQAAQRRQIKIFLNGMSYPPWMKTNRVARGGALKNGYEDEAVEFILIWLLGLKNLMGVTVDFVNFENEPNWQHGYEGTALTPRQVVTLTKKLGDRLIAEGLPTKIVPAEPNALGQFSPYSTALHRDEEARAHVYAYSVHSYMGAGTFFWPDHNNSEWTKVRTLADSYGRPVWLTEYCLDDRGVGRKGTWAEAIAAVQHVHNALTHGNVTVWLWHELYNDPSHTPIALIDKDNLAPGRTVYPKFYTLRQYFRYVRPGAVRIDAQCSDHDILVTAFNHKIDQTLTIIAINRKRTDENLDCTISGLEDLPRLSTVRTSQNENASNAGSVMITGNRFSFTLPAQSITTFTGRYGAATGS